MNTVINDNEHDDNNDDDESIIDWGTLTILSTYDVDIPLSLKYSGMSAPSQTIALYK